jgi:hypothetical protein
MGPQPPGENARYFQLLQIAIPKYRTGIGAHPKRQKALNLSPSTGLCQEV